MGRGRSVSPVVSAGGECDQAGWDLSGDTRGRVHPVAYPAPLNAVTSSFNPCRSSWMRGCARSSGGFGWEQEHALRGQPTGWIARHRGRVGGGLEAAGNEEGRGAGPVESNVEGLACRGT